jgi:hypothetical protein
MSTPKSPEEDSLVVERADRPSQSAMGVAAAAACRYGPGPCARAHQCPLQGC